MFVTETHGEIERIRMARSVLGRPIHEVSAYRLGSLLVDCGPPATGERLTRWAEERGVTRVVATHHHEDHVGGAAPLARGLGVPVEAPEGALPILLEGARIPLYRRWIWGTPERLPVAALARLPERFEHGPYRFRVVPTPGHAFDHVCLFEEERGWLVSGDLFVHERVPVGRKIEDFVAHLDSIDRVLALEPELLICAHAGVMEDARGALRRKARFWRDLAGAVRERHRRGDSLRQITRELLGREGRLHYMSFGDFSKRNLVAALLELPDDPPHLTSQSAAANIPRF